MQPAEDRLAAAINNVTFNTPMTPIYQNFVAKAVNNKLEIKTNLLKQLTAPVKWTQIMQQMLQDGVTDFYEIGPGNVLQGLLKKVDKTADFIDFEAKC